MRKGPGKRGGDAETRRAKDDSELFDSELSVESWTIAEESEDGDERAFSAVPDDATMDAGHDGERRRRTDHGSEDEELADPETRWGSRTSNHR